jgi:L-seryl-tRNA(Ser) seleniumtransferase
VTDARRTLPAVDRLLRLPAVEALTAAHPRALVVRAVRDAVAEVRDAGASPPADWSTLVATHLDRLATPTLRRCVNATGVVLHTNLGRAPLAPAAVAAMQAAAAGYSSLELDVASGERGSRHVHCAGLLTELTGAADAMVVNNAASALVLALAAAAGGGAAVVARGELIEIGGGFRIPEIMETSGTRLVEVGTTNRTRVRDYAKALMDDGRTGDRKSRSVRRSVGDASVVLLKVHRSNFRLVGFTEDASLEELVALGRKAKAPVLYDLGGGLMLDLAGDGLAGEPTLPDAAASGASAVIASGDKLLGGPQAGIIVGTKRFLAACRAHPFARAARADKLTLAALAATLGLYRDPAAARREVPVVRMLTTPAGVLEARAAALAAALPPSAHAAVVRTRAAVGGGAFPGVELPSHGVALAPAGISAQALAGRLRGGAVPVIGVVQRGRVVLDVRALLPGDDAAVAAAVSRALAP